MLNPCGTEVSASDAFCTGRTKSYPDGAIQYMACSSPVFALPGWERSGKDKVKAVPKAAQVDPQEPRKPTRANLDRAVRRAKAQVRDIALCTPFTHFVTLTLDQDKIDRYDMSIITRKLKSWLDNQVRRHGLSYVLVPERHKDGAVHFHGFFNDALTVSDSGTITMDGWPKPRRPRNAEQREKWLADGGRIVWNLPAWTWGFTTAIELYGPYDKAVSYVCKYIGKQEGGPVSGNGGDSPGDLVSGKIGGRWYYSGGELGHPVVHNEDISVSEVAAMKGAFVFHVPEAWLSFAVAYWPGTGERPKALKKERKASNNALPVPAPVVPGTPGPGGQDPITEIVQFALEGWSSFV